MKELCMFRINGYSLSYRIHGPKETELGAEHRAKIARLPNVLQAAGTCLILFDLPDDVVPPLDGEQRFRRPKCRVVPLSNCPELFSKIWEETSYFGGMFVLFLVACF